MYIFFLFHFLNQSSNRSCDLSLMSRMLEFYVTSLNVIKHEVATTDGKKSDWLWMHQKYETSTVSPVILSNYDVLDEEINRRKNRKKCHGKASKWKINLWKINDYISSKVLKTDEDNRMNWNGVIHLFCRWRNKSNFFKMLPYIKVYSWILHQNALRFLNLTKWS